jgi:PAB-dependent poly(A)-specific ribonuclease subunit 3
VAPYRENLLAYQRTTHDFFMPEDIREEYQRKAEATLQTLPSKSLEDLCYK